jgi:DNA adenine methylase
MENRPFLKWAGNKYRILPKIRSLLPPGQRLIEPFVGSGAVFLNMDYKQYLLADSNLDLISLFTLLREDSGAFVRKSKKLFTPSANSQEVYYQRRLEFNATADQEDRAALFVYLNRHGYNGLCRYNAKGIFNVPFGRYAQVYFPESELLAFAARAAQAEFVCEDFTEVMQRAVPGDVVYCDPPYVPLSQTSHFTSYSALGFGLEEQKRLAELAQSLSARGVPVLISNHDTVLTQEYYQNARLSSFEVRRSISCKGASRGKVLELLALYQLG